MNSHNSNLDPSQTDSPLVAIQVSGIVPFSAEAWFESTIESTGQPALLGTELNHALKIARASFDQRFEKTFKLASKGFSAEKVGSSPNTLLKLTIKIKCRNKLIF